MRLYASLGAMLSTCSCVTVVLLSMAIDCAALPSVLSSASLHAAIISLGLNASGLACMSVIRPASVSIAIVRSVSLSTLSGAFSGLYGMPSNEQACSLVSPRAMCCLILSSVMAL